MQPAQSIIDKFGGAKIVADIVGVHRTRVWNWTRERKAGGTGGIVPFRHVPTLLAAAAKRGIALTAEDFLPAEQAARPKAARVPSTKSRGYGIPPKRRRA